MNLHEYQAKNILKSYNIFVPNFKTASTVSEAESAFSQLNGEKMAIKAQIHAGGRGKSGGVKIVSLKNEVHEFAEKWLGKNLVTYQNGPQGQPVHRLLLEETVDIAEELYFSILIDRQSESVAMICSSSGGMDIEEVSENTPELINKINFKINQDPSNSLIKKLIESFNKDVVIENEFINLVKNSLKIFVEKDLSLLEINPLVITKDRKLVALDCKMSIDDNALFRHEDVLELQDWTQVDEKEADAHHAGLNYIALDGEIGCMVNGAGLAMATMDLIKLCGGEPANFLDVGGGATAETVSKAFKILLSDKNVKVVLVNIFGGIMRCDIIANGIIAAVKEVGVNIPIVVRLEGTNVDIGKQILKDSNLNILAAENLKDAAQKAVELSGKH
jgi:succinyl-CoA synthetase beta subunit